MATIILPADFIGQVNIPGKADVGENLQSFIDKYEPDFLEKLLGDSLYAAYKLDSAAERFTVLVDKFKIAELNYVYWFYMEDQQIITTTIGPSQPKKLNAVTLSPYPKMIRAWNEMVDLNKKLHKFLSGSATYPEYHVSFPTWFYVNGWFPDFDFDFDWYAENGNDCLPDIFLYKNALGV